MAFRLGRNQNQNFAQSSKLSQHTVVTGGALPSPVKADVSTQSKGKKPANTHIYIDTDSDSDDIYEELVGLDSALLWKWFEQKAKQ